MVDGLTTKQAKDALDENGLNEIPQQKTSILAKIAKNIVSPIALMLLGASLLSFLIDKIFDGYFILILLVINVGITIWQEQKADTAIEKLNEHLKQTVKVLRDNIWTHIPSSFLVVGDVVELSLGEVIPADGTVRSGTHVSVNESVLTGESLPKDKSVGDQLFSGSFIATGLCVMEVTATGVHTNFGKTIFSVERLRKTSLLERDILSIAKFLTVISILAVVILSIVLYFHNAPVLELLTLDLSLIIAGIPISLPTVMTLIIEFGVLALVDKNIVVRRLSALEDLANVNYLLTDKTGTLTKNLISVQDVYAYDGFTHEDVVLLSSIMASKEGDNPIDRAIVDKAHTQGVLTPNVQVVDFVPADSVRKRSTLVYTHEGKIKVLSVGAPQIVAGFVSMSPKQKEKFTHEVETLAKEGFRTIAVASGQGKEEKNLKIVGLLALSDTIREDAKGIIEFLTGNGIAVSMVTGDNRAIAVHVAQTLAIERGSVVTKRELGSMKDEGLTRSLFAGTGAFAEILPEDKLRLVENAKKFFIVAATGDGINDLPALKAANVGIAVKNAVSALKATADIVLLSDGIQVIRDAIIESRKIFARLYTYSLYRISESLRLIITIVLLGLLAGTYPLTPLQIILLALLNDIPIISLAGDRVHIPKRPAKIDAIKRFSLGSVYGLVGVINSMLLYVFVTSVWKLPWSVVQTMFFLKFTVSGHMLIYVAHTKDRWYRYFPSKGVILATTLTQLTATGLALTGFLMSSNITLAQAGFVWIWSFFFMQLTEVAKVFQLRVTERR